MSERRSNRSKKQVDYSKFADLGGDDDDFADSTPPPPKKSKLSNKENKSKDKRNTDIRAELPVKVKQKTKRLSTEEKYDEELKAALELSLNDSQEKTNESRQKINGHVTSQMNSSNDVPIIIEPVKDYVSNISEKSVEAASLEPSNESVNNASEDVSEELCIGAVKHCRTVKAVLQGPDSDIEILGSVPVSDEPPAKRRRCGSTDVKNKKQQIDSDGDFDGSEIDMDDDESDEDYNGNDSDFEVFGKKKQKGQSNEPKNKTKKAAKSPKTKKGAKTVPVKNKVSVTPKPAARSLCTPGVSNSLMGSSPSSIGLKRTSQGSMNTLRSPVGGVTVKSPSSIRLGLSRNQKVKPLHPTVKIQH